MKGDYFKNMDENQLSQGYRKHQRGMNALKAMVWAQTLEPRGKVYSRMWLLSHTRGG